jgi:beta-N-acetylhexosaminidase
VSNSPPRAVIFGLAGTRIGDAEARLFAAANPLGFILFARNCRDPQQVRALTAALRSVVGRADAPILIDQEGGRVQRLKPPHWRAAPAAARFGALASVCEAEACEAVWLNARLIAAELSDLGIDHDCAPVLDVPAAGADPVIGDRAFASDPDQVARLGQAFAAGLLAGGVNPIIKHIPGHGRADADSHVALPVVDIMRDELLNVDAAPFAALSCQPWAMTAHVLYAAIDANRPATMSPVVVREVIRGAIGFDGVLVSDDLCMRALDGRPAERASAALAAGCDVVLHCNAVLDEMRAIAAAVPPLTEAAQARLARAREALPAPELFNQATAGRRLDALLAGAGAELA